MNATVLKRRIVIAAIFLLAGAVVNVAVAWACGIRPNTVDAGGDYSLDHVYYPSDTKCFDWWTAHAPRGFASEADLLIIGTAEFGISTITFGLSDDHENFDMPLQHVTRLRSGLPMHSMEGAVWFDLPSSRTIWDAVIYLPHDDVSSPSLLLRPVWPGFALNTVFYAVVLWLLICGLFALRRFIRMKRGLCPKCAYPRGQADVCSECGKVLIRSRSTS